MRGGAEPEVPIESGGDRRRFGRAVDTLGPDGSVGPVVDFADAPDSSCPYPFAEQPRIFRGLIDGAELGGDLVLSGGFCHPAGFENGVRQRFLAVDMLSRLHRRDGDCGVGVVGSNHEHGVDAFLLFEHLAKIVVGSAGAVVVFFVDDVGGPFAVVCIDVADGDNPYVIFGQECLHIARALVADADTGDIDFFTWWDTTGTCQDRVGKNSQGRRCCCAADEITSGKFLVLPIGILFFIHFITPQICFCSVSRKLC